MTLIDTGPNAATAMDELEVGLAALGHRVEDIGLVVLTHHHMDHIGLVEILVEHSGAEVAAIGIAADRLAAFAEDSELEDRFAVEVMLRNGIPEDVTVALQGVSRSYRDWGSHAVVTKPLADGEELVLRDRRLQTLHRPGHSPSDTIFWDERRGLLFVGDHLISNISSNPLISRPLDGSERRSQSLVTYIESMQKTRAMPAEILFAGHGEPITDHVALIDARLAAHERRKEKIHGLIAERARTGYELAQAIWGNVAVTQAFLTLSEVIGHADILVNEGRVREADDGAVIRYEAT